MAWAGESGSSGQFESFDAGESDFLANDLANLETGDLGDLSDVPQMYLREVVDLLRSLPGPHDDPGDTAALRIWIQNIKRLAGFSREATIRLFATIAQCLEAPRAKGYDMLSSKSGLQQAFVRLDGVQQTINIMLLRLSDPSVVAQAARILAAVSQDNPHAAQTMFEGGADKVRLLIRAIERHESDFGVVESACLFFMHISSLTPGPPGMEAGLPRTSAHREIQSLLASEGGVIDLLVHFLTHHLEKVKDETKNTERISTKAINDSKNITLKPGARVATTAAATQGNAEVRQAWLNLDVVEVTGARIQELVLQALMLVVLGNPDNIRQLMGELWIWGNAQHNEEHANQAAATSASAAKRGSQAPDKKKKREPPQKLMGPSGGKKGSSRPVSREDKVTDAATEIPLEERRSLTTLEAFSKVSRLFVEVLQGTAARDRPDLASKAARLLRVLADHSISLLKRVEQNRSRDHAEVYVKLRPGPIPANNRKPEAPFAHLKQIVGALTYAARTHKEDVGLLTEVLGTLFKLKELAMLSAPAGVEQRSEDLLYAWQRLLADAELQGELEEGNNLLKRAWDETNAANERMRVTGITLDQLIGGTIWLTPRLHKVVLETSLGGAELVGDALASRWRNGEPTRIERKKQELAADHAEEESPDSSPLNRGKKSHKTWAGSKAGQRSSVKSEKEAASSQSSPKGKRNLGHSKSVSALKAPDAARKPDVETPVVARRNSTRIPQALAAALRSTALNSNTPGTGQVHEEEFFGSKRRGGLKVAKEGGIKVPDPKADKKKKKKEEKENAVPPEFAHAIGYEELDEPGFQQFWANPLQDALQRSMAMPCLRTQRMTKMSIAQAPVDFASLGVTWEDGEGETVPQVFSSALTAQKIQSAKLDPAKSQEIHPELLTSEPGLLRTRVVLPSMSEEHFKASERRLKQLMQGEVAGDEVSTAICKNMRKSGYLMPVYGVQVQFKKGSRLGYQEGATPHPVAGGADATPLSFMPSGAAFGA